MVIIHNVNFLTLMFILWLPTRMSLFEELHTEVFKCVGTSDWQLIAKWSRKKKKTLCSRLSNIYTFKMIFKF